MVEVGSVEEIPVGRRHTTSGRFVCRFLYKDDARDATTVFQYILGRWLVNSEYELDVRLHFEVLGDRYKKDDPDSEEQIWIPVKKIINKQKRIPLSAGSFFVY